MMTYACPFSQSELGKYFEWIITMVIQGGWPQGCCYCCALPITLLVIQWNNHKWRIALFGNTTSKLRLPWHRQRKWENKLSCRYIGRLLGFHHSFCIVKLTCKRNNGNAMVALISKIAISSIEIIGTLIWLEVSVKALIPLPGLIICIHHPPLSPALPPTLGSLMIRAYVLARYTAVRALNL